MTKPSDLPLGGALAALQQLESKLQDNDNAEQAARQQMIDTRAEAQRILAAARAAGAESGRRRREAILERAQRDVATIRAASAADAALIAQSTTADREALIAELTDVVLDRQRLAKEVSSHAGANDSSANSWTPKGHRANASAATAGRAGAAH